MGAPAVVLGAPAHTAAAPLRALQLWHLLSLDAPTVAFCWVLLFAQSLHVPHALPAAGALACAVWIVYAADRLLDARRAVEPEWDGAPQSDLPRLYSTHAITFLFAGAGVAMLAVALLMALPRQLVEAWLLLTGPLALYAVAVHVLHLTARWKAVCVGLFFAAAAALPAAVHGTRGWPLAAAAVAFGGVCRVNCAVLRAPARRLRIVHTVGVLAAMLPWCFPETREIAPACLLALLLLTILVRRREEISARLGALTWRALVDAALIAPVPAVALATLLLR